MKHCSSECELVGVNELYLWIPVKMSVNGSSSLFTQYCCEPV